MCYRLACGLPSAKACFKFYYLVALLGEDACGTLAAVATTTIEGYWLILWKYLRSNLGKCIFKNINIIVRARNETLGMLRPCAHVKNDYSGVCNDLFELICANPFEVVGLTE